MSVFKVAGVSTLGNKTKVRFANDLVSRVKMLVKDGHQDIELVELPSAMTKSEVVNFLKTTNLVNTPRFADAIANADEKYNTVKVSKKPEISLEAIKTRAGITA